ncbi:MAG: transposase [Longimicrobiaceae bacterium]
MTSSTPLCPHCQSEAVVRNGHKGARQRFLCRTCRKSFGPTHGTPLYGLHTPAAEIARTLLLVLRRGSLRAAEEISGHKYETIGTWLRRAAAHAEAITEVLVRELHLSEVEVDAFWSFVKKSAAALQQKTPPRAGWARLPEPTPEPTPKSVPAGAA